MKPPTIPWAPLMRLNRPIPAILGIAIGEIETRVAQVPPSLPLRSHHPPLLRTLTTQTLYTNQESTLRGHPFHHKHHSSFLSSTLPITPCNPIHDTGAVETSNRYLHSILDKTEGGPSRYQIDDLISPHDHVLIDQHRLNCCYINDPKNRNLGYCI